MRKIFLPTLLLLLTACSQQPTAPTPAQPLTSEACSKLLTTYPAQAGSQYDLYTLLCATPQTTPHGQVRVVGLDQAAATPEAKSSLESTTQLITPSIKPLGVTQDQTLYVKTVGAGSKIQPSAYTFLADDLTRQEYTNLKPLVNDILSVYGNPTTTLGQLRALRDWVARIAIHPHPPFHAATTKNLAVLPTGWDWAQFEALSEGGQRWSRDTDFWTPFNLNGYKMLNRLLNIDGTETHPMLEKVGTAQYRIKQLTENSDDPNDPNVYRTSLCTGQGQMVLALANALGVYGSLISTTGHDTFAFYLPDYRKWIYMDPSYDEDYLNAYTGQPASPEELYIASTLGTGTKDFIVAKIKGPTWDPEVYADPADHPRATYFGDGHPKGFTAMGNNLLQVLQPEFNVNLLQYDAPIFYNNPTDPATVGLSKRNRIYDMSILFPVLGVSVADSTQLDERHIQIKLASNWPSHDHFETLATDGSWQPLTTDPVLTLGDSPIQVRSVNNAGITSQVAEFSASHL